MALVTPLRDQYEHVCQYFYEFCESDLQLNISTLGKIKQIISNEKPDTHNISDIIYSCDTYLSEDKWECIEFFFKEMNRAQYELHKLELSEFGKL